MKVPPTGSLEEEATKTPVFVPWGRNDPVISNVSKEMLIFSR